MKQFKLLASVLGQSVPSVYYILARGKEQARDLFMTRHPGAVVYKIALEQDNIVTVAFKH